MSTTRNSYGTEVDTENSVRSFVRFAAIFCFSIFKFNVFVFNDNHSLYMVDVIQTSHVVQ